MNNQGILSLLFSFEGRVGRDVFWGWFVAYFVITFVVTYLVVSSVAADDPNQVDMASRGVGALLTLVLFWPSLAITVKRWHDVNKSGWWVLINLIPLLGFVISIVFNGFIAGTKGKNRFDRE